MRGDGAREAFKVVPAFKHGHDALVSFAAREIHEPPRLGKSEKIRLQAGMAITIEPGVYLEGFGGIRIEDTIVVTRQGCEILTGTSKELRMIGG